MDLNDKSDIRQIFKLFDRVVVDIEVTKYIGNSHKCGFLRVFLVDNPSSTLIVPAQSGGVTVCEDKEDQPMHYDAKALKAGNIRRSILDVGCEALEKAIFIELNDKLEQYGNPLKRWFDEIEIKYS